MRYFKNPLKLLLPALLAFLLSAQSGSAQNTIGFIPYTISGWEDTVYAGPDTVLIGGMLKNYSTTTAFTAADSLYLNGYVDTGSTNVPFSFPYWQYNPSLTLGAGDTAFLILPFVFDSVSPVGPQFHVGNNVVVVWPIGVGPGSFNPNDSVTLNVFIIDTVNGLPSDPPGSFVRIYPVPANGPLVISSYHPQYHITFVTIRDAQGRAIYEGVPNGPINTDGWARGLYTVEAALSNGTVSWYKIMRQ